MQSLTVMWELRLNRPLCSPYQRHPHQLHLLVVNCVEECLCADRDVAQMSLCKRICWMEHLKYCVVLCNLFCSTFFPTSHSICMCQPPVVWRTNVTYSNVQHMFHRSLLSRQNQHNMTLFTCTCTCNQINLVEVVALLQRWMSPSPVSQRRKHILSWVFLSHHFSNEMNASAKPAAV